MMPTVVFVLLASFYAAVPGPVFPIRVTGEWRVELGPGAAAGVSLEQAVLLDITPPGRISVQDEHHETLGVYNPHAGGWARGAPARRTPFRRPPDSGETKNPAGRGRGTPA